jgi:hypothetical protein
LFGAGGALACGHVYSYNQKITKGGLCIERSLMNFFTRSPEHSTVSTVKVKNHNLQVVDLLFTTWGPCTVGGQRDSYDWSDNSPAQGNKPA